MAVTIGSPSVKAVFGDFRIAVIPVTFDASYPTGGEVVDFTADGTFSTVTEVLPLPSGGTLATWVQSTKKLLAWYQDGDAAEFVQVTSTDDLTAETVNCLVFGK